MIKILVVGTLLLGSLVLLTSILPAARQQIRSRRMLGTVRNPTAMVATFSGLEEKRGPDGAREAGVEATDGKIRKTEEEWKAQLTEQQYQVTRCSGTERPFTGKFWNHHEEGTYTCVGCGQELFSSEAKFDSGTGWPSYSQPVKEQAIDEIKDISYGMVRTEIVCSRCEAHLGHVFPDGPRPTGLRYCVNSASLDFVRSDEEAPHGRTAISSGN
jgi:peptide-methionine (R)-S-oxide reductase